MFARFGCLHLRETLVMFCECSLLFWALALISGNALASFMRIDWNVSRDRGGSHLERDYKYPMYQEVAPVPCDLTTSCDASCCRDPDCGGHRASQCPRPRRTCSHFLSSFDCNCYDSDAPEWLFAFCYVHKNPIYLGKFHKTLAKIDEFPVLKSLICKEPLFCLGRKDWEPEARPANPLGSSIMTFVPASHSFPSLNALLRKTPLRDSAYACTFSPVKYRTDDLSLCLTKVTRNLCQEGRALGALPHLVESSHLPARGAVPVVVKGPDSLEPLRTEVAFKCVELESKTVRFKKQALTFLHKHSSKACPHPPETYHTAVVNSTCLNALAHLHYQFVLNGTDVVQLKVEYGLANISLPLGNMLPKYIYLKQKFSTNFFDILRNSFGNQNQSANDDEFNRGYLIGEELNFGYKQVENSSREWARGLLGVFGSGGSCDSSSPVAFGHQLLSVCRLRRRFANCTRLREAVEEKLEGLLRGDSLAAYANLRAPYSNSVPLLRSFGSRRGGGAEGSWGCEVPAVQGVVVQYTSLRTASGRLVHRVVGVRVDRAFRNVSTDADVLLTARALFLQVTPSKDKLLSRFWRRVLRRELSENSWLNILNGVEDVGAAEREEVAFWCTALMLSVAVAVVCGGAEADLDYFV